MPNILNDRFDRQPLIAPSVLAADLSDLQRECLLAQQAGANWLHLDVMDGHFVPNITFGPASCKAMRKHISGIMDLHLMINPHHRLMNDFIGAAPDVITIHLEVQEQLAASLDAIKAAGIARGLAIKPSTPVEQLVPWLDDIDLICVMTVEPGFGGQSFLKSQIDTIISIKKLIDRRPILLQIDGGVNEDSLPLASDIGIDIFVAGSSFYIGGGHEATFYRERLDVLTQFIRSK